MGEMTRALPLCESTEIPRLLCDHCQSFTMTPSEVAYLNGWEVYAPATSAPSARRVIPEYSGGGFGIPGEVKVANTDIRCDAGCGRTRDESVFVCAQCIENLEVALGDVPALLADLEVLAAKQARFSASGKGNDRSPLPFNPHAADRIAYLSNEVTSAVRMLCQSRGIRPQVTDAVSASRWLLRNVHAVALDQAGPDVTVGILREHRRAIFAIDRPPDRPYIGVCDLCQTPMHAKEGEPEFTCATCSATYVVAERKAKIDAKVQTALLSLREIADLSARHLGGKITLKQLEGLVRRRRLTAAGVRRDPDRETSLYRAADVVAIMEERRAS